MTHDKKFIKLYKLINDDGYFFIGCCSQKTDLNQIIYKYKNNESKYKNINKIYNNLEKKSIKIILIMNNIEKLSREENLKFLHDYIQNFKDDNKCLNFKKNIDNSHVEEYKNNIKNAIKLMSR